MGPLLLALVLVVAAAACEPAPPPNPPFWHPGTTVDATNRGPLVRIEWDATTGGNPANSYQISLGTYDGTVVALVPATTRACDITGLAANTAYTIVVTARDSTQAWSGPLPGTQGNRTTTITTTGHGSSGTLWCHPVTDTDGDGLSDALETDDGTYSSASDAGTDPAVADTDGDGISDGDEALGLAGPNLVAMGARPTHRDLLVEVDWIGSAPCAIQPTSTKVADAVTGFARAPLTNPDGTGGIKLILDYGQGGAFTGGNEIPDPDSTPDGRFTGQNVAGALFTAAKASHFAPNRRGIFHYSVTHTSGQSTADSGTHGDDTYVGFGCGATGYRYAASFMHELGHNLGLGHGGVYNNPPDYYRVCDVAADECTYTANINNKPNYVSIMNYTYLQGIGARDCERHDTATGPLDFSRGTNAPIDENALNESVGICNGVPYDFNRNHVIDPGTYALDIANDFGFPVGQGLKTVLHDTNDWDYIDRLGLRSIAEFGT